MRALVAGLLALLPIPAGAEGAGELSRHEFARPHMGTTFRLVLHAASAEEASRAAEAAFARVAELDAALSDYREDSELSALCRRAGGPPVAVGEDLFRVLAAAQDWARRTGGAFDVTAGPVVQLWRRARRIREMPSEAALAEARALGGAEKMTLDAAARTVRLAVAGMRLDLGGIAKGYAADEAQAVLRAHGITRALVAAGGDVVVSGPPPGRGGWSVAVALDEALADDAPVLALRDAAVSTSGDATQFVTLGGVRHSHIVDPRTGRALTGRRAATVVARTGAEADALATALCVLPPEKGLALVEATAGAAARVVRDGSAGVETLESGRWKARTGPAQPAEVTTAAAR